MSVIHFEPTRKISSGREGHSRPEPPKRTEKPPLTEEDVADIAATRENLAALMQKVQDIKRSDPGNSYLSFPMNHLAQVIGRLQETCARDLGEIPDDA